MSNPEVLALERAKIQLMRIPNTVFYTTILFSLKQSWTDRIKTAATDGLHLYINPEYWLSLSEQERIGLLVHEMLHVALSHMVRKGPRDPKIWNIAGDHVINLAILETEKYSLPAGALQDGRFKDMNTEQVYRVIYDELEKQVRGGGAGAEGLNIPGGADVEYPQDSNEVETIAREVADIVAKATMQAQSECSMPGEVPGEMQVQLQKIFNPKLPWNVILQNFLNGMAKDDFTWRRPNRRYLPDYYLPSAFSEAIGKIAIAVDSSGSVSDEEFSFFINEIASIQESLKPEEILLVDFDTKIRNTHKITADTNVWTELNFTGRGGTQIEPVLEWAKEHNPQALLIFTDGDFHMPVEKKDFPTCPIIWLIHDAVSYSVPVGEVILYDIKDLI